MSLTTFDSKRSFKTVRWRIDPIRREQIRTIKVDEKEKNQNKTSGSSGIVGTRLLEVFRWVDFFLLW
jgi:hypothetical protein